MVGMVASFAGGPNSSSSPTARSRSRSPGPPSHPAGATGHAPHVLDGAGMRNLVSTQDVRSPHLPRDASAVRRLLPPPCRASQEPPVSAVMLADPPLSATVVPLPTHVFSKPRATVILGPADVSFQLATSALTWPASVEQIGEVPASIYEVSYLPLPAEVLDGPTPPDTPSPESSASSRLEVQHVEVRLFFFNLPSLYTPSVITLQTVSISF